jgi:ABC-type transport system involved in cytochrome bd biosynthesis fused ATPase/permease subunit
MRDCAVPEHRGLYYPGHTDLVLTRIRFPVALGERFQIVGVPGCAVSRIGEPGNSWLAEEI